MTTTLIALRSDLGLSRAEMAQLLGMAEGQVRNIEAGYRQPNQQTRRLLAILADPEIGARAVERVRSSGVDQPDATV